MVCELRNRDTSGGSEYPLSSNQSAKAEHHASENAHVAER
jgi:hypothetical protein